MPRKARSSMRTLSSHSSRCSPANTKGCLAIANMLDAENRLEMASTSASVSVPGGVCSKGIPALSSTSMPHRRNCAATRTASSRSGVISAMRFCETSSAPRMRTAIALASCALSSASNHFACGRLLRNAGKPCHMTLCSGRQNISEIAAPFGSARATGKISISLRSTPIRSSRCFRWNCGCTSMLRRRPKACFSSSPSGERSFHRASDRSRSTPGKITCPLALNPTRRSTRATALADVVIPMAMIGSVFPCSARRRSSAPRRWLRRSAGPISLRATNAVR